MLRACALAIDWNRPSAASHHPFASIWMRLPTQIVSQGSRNRIAFGPPPSSQTRQMEKCARGRPHGPVLFQSDGAARETRGIEVSRIADELLPQPRRHSVVGRRGDHGRRAEKYRLAVFDRLG